MTGRVWVHYTPAKRLTKNQMGFKVGSKRWRRLQKSLRMVEWSELAAHKEYMVTPVGIFVRKGETK